MRITIPALALLCAFTLVAAMRLQTQRAHHATTVVAPPSSSLAAEPALPQPLAPDTPHATTPAAPLAVPPAPARRESPPPTAPPSPQEKALETGVDARIADRSLLDILELLRADSGMAFQYDPELREKFSTMRISLDVASADLKQTLEFLQEFAGFEVEYTHDRVIFRKKTP